MGNIDKLLDELATEPLSYDVINFKKYMDTVKGWLKQIALYHIIHDFIKHLLSVILNAFDGMFEFSANFKILDLVTAEFTGKMEFPITRMK